jgi:hypothetical protein
VRSRFFSPALVAVVAFCLNAALWVRSEPEPIVHDEFSYLLAADTFAHGRLTNPTHPMWRHFETFHVLQRPSYQSKYPPGQGLVLAAGTVVAGEPIVGVWLSFALACAAVTWMLQGWLPWRWALFGGMLAALHPVMGAWWGQTYWGGALPMAGGALVYGAVPRLLRRERVSASLWLGAGLAILELSRPVEGALAALPALAFLLWRRLRAGRASGWRSWAPAASIVIATTAWLGYYDWSVTGDPLRTPYQVWNDQYQRPTSDMHPDLRRYHGSPQIGVLPKVQRLADFYAPFPLALGLVGLYWTRRSRWTRVFAAGAAALLAASVAFSRAWPHYTAPAAAGVLALFVQGFRGLWRAGGRGALRACVVLCPLVPLATALRPDAGPLWIQGRMGRSEVVRLLAGTREDHLVFVRYGPGHDASVEWVYNEADIDAAHVVWAREIGPREDAELVRYFSGRRAWLLMADEAPPRLTPWTLRPTP